MKKLNRQEITAIAYRIQENIDKAKKANYKSVERLIVEAKLLPEYKKISKLKSNSAVREALELINLSSMLDQKQKNIIVKYVTSNGYNRVYVKGNFTYVPVKKETLIDQIKRDITLEQLMSDDLQKMIDTITKRYINV